jgi:phosphate transport system substrate-binding protein
MLVFLLFVHAAVGGDVVHIQGGGASSMELLFKQFALTFQSLKPSVSLEYNATGSGVVENYLRSREWFWIGSDVGLSLVGNTTDTLLFPISAVPLVLVYNVPEAGDQQLLLTRSDMVDVFSGRILLWNDARLVANNPKLANVSRPIQLVLRKVRKKKKSVIDLFC